MKYDTLLDLVAELGYNLAMAGAETFRIEDSINRILASYGIESEVFAIPNCMTISIHTADGKSMTRIKRIGFHGNDLDSVERYNSLSRRICAEKPDPDTAVQWLKEVNASRISYKLPLILLGHILGAAGFCVFFGGCLVDALCAGLCGALIGLTDRFFVRFETNQFFRTIASAFIMTIVAYITAALGIAENIDAVIIGPLMILVPGLIFTNALRDIIFGDTNSGINRIVQVLLVAAAIALGTGVAWSIGTGLFGMSGNPTLPNTSILIECIGCFIGCTGFFIVFNIHGFGGFVCAFGGVATWVAFCLAEHFGCDNLVCYFIATLTAATYAEIMARVRKFPAISYLVISIFPLIPGAGIYYATNHLINGDMASFASKCKQTIAIAGVIAVGILVISSLVRLTSKWRLKKH